MSRSLRSFSLLLVVLGVGLWWMRSRIANEASKAIQVASTEDKTAKPAPQPQSFNLPAPRRPTEAMVKLQILQAILDSKNDNDPRLDTEFNSLAPETRSAMRQKYRELAAERRNDRGTIVFLLGKNLSSPDDIHFMKEVLEEPACLSLANCKKANEQNKDPDSVLGADITRAYPQLVALTKLHDFLASRPSATLRREAQALLLREASKSSVPVLRNKARGLLSDLHGR